MSDVTVQLRENGPILISGPVTFKDSQGNSFDVSGKAAFALCRCTQSKNKPFCDGSHKGCGYLANELVPANT